MTGNTGLASEKKLPVWKHIVFSILTVGFILALLESSLALFGIQPESRQLDPYVGFVPSIPLYVEKTAADGTRFLVTAENKLHLFNAQSFTRQKAPNTVRVCLFYGHIATVDVDLRHWISLLEHQAYMIRYAIEDAAFLHHGQCHQWL